MITISKSYIYLCLNALKDVTLLGCSADFYSVLEQVYQANFLPPMGHAVSVMLHLVETEGMRQLRLASITCIQDLAVLNSKGLSLIM